MSLGFGSSTQSSNQTSVPVWLQQPGAAKQLFETYSDVFSGNMNSPSAKALTALTQGQAQKGVQQQRQQIASNKSLSGPARNALLKQLADLGVSSAAGVSGQMFGSARDILAMLAGTGSSYSSTGSSSGGGYSFGVSAGGAG
jgi:hypothetical protein